MHWGNVSFFSFLFLLLTVKHDTLEGFFLKMPRGAPSKKEVLEFVNFSILLIVGGWGEGANVHMYDIRKMNMCFDKYGGLVSWLHV